MHIAKYWNAEDSKIRCNLCQRSCLIPEDSTGFCRVRKNINGKLYSLVYGRPAAINVDPIEKKPFYHFHPGTLVLSFGTIGCNFACKFCCNWEISQEMIESFEEVLPEKIIEFAKKSKVSGIAYTYTEPTIFFEYAFDTAKLAKENGLYNVFVTNGYIQEKPLKDISKFLDAAVINFKGNNKEFYQKYSSADLDLVKRGALYYKKYIKHVEITNLVVPNLNDDFEELRDQIKWIISNFGEKTPYHILRFFPSYKMSNVPPTDVKKLIEIYNLAKKEGLKYVYIGNISDPEYNSTFCPNCGELIIKRSGMLVVNINQKNGRCPKCGQKLDILF